MPIPTHTLMPINRMIAHTRGRYTAMPPTSASPKNVHRSHENEQIPLAKGEKMKNRCCGFRPAQYNMGKSTAANVIDVPRSGSFATSIRGTSTKINGSTRYRTRSRLTFLWDRYLARANTVATFTNSDGWIRTGPNTIHRLAPSAAGRINTTKRNTTASPNSVYANA